MLGGFTSQYKTYITVPNLGSTEIKKSGLNPGNAKRGGVLSLPKLDGALFLFIEMLTKRGGLRVLDLPKFFGALFVQKVGGS